MVSVNPENSPFGMPGSYQPLAAPNAFAGVGGIGNPGSIVSAGGGVPIPNMQRDGNNNSNRVIPYHRVVGVNNEESVKQIEDLQGGSLALIGQIGIRRSKVTAGQDLPQPSRIGAQQSGPDSFSNLASLQHVEGMLSSNDKDVSLYFNTATAQLSTDGVPKNVSSNGYLKADGSKRDDKMFTDAYKKAMDDNSSIIYRQGSKNADGCCFLAPKSFFMISPKNITPSTGSKRQRGAGNSVNTNDSIPSDAAKFVLQTLYGDMARTSGGPQPFTMFSPDGLVIYKYSTSNDKFSSKNTGSLDYQLDQKQGAVYNIAVSGPALAIDWTYQPGDTDMSRRCLCLPRNNVYLLVVAKMEDNSLKKNSMRFLRTTSCDLSEHANEKDWMGLNQGELIIGGWSIGSVIDNAATPMSSHSPDIQTVLMGIRIAVKIRFVDSYELFSRYWRKEHPTGASRLRK